MLTDLVLRDYRCFRECKVSLHPSMTLLVGRNAQGKTSLMEAACVLLRLQSPRTSTRGDLIHMGATSLLIEGRVSGEIRRYTQTRTARRLAIDGAVCSRAADYLASSGRVVWMDHRDMNLLRGGGEHRRRYLDFAASQIYSDYLKALRGYERALRGRNYVLKRDAVIQWRQADAFARVMAEFAQVLTTRRSQLITALQPEVTRIHSELSGDEEMAFIQYNAASTAGNLVEELAALREEEQRTRQTSAGPHRDDLGLSLNDMPAGNFASEGQQRSFALALKIAQACVLESASGKPPLMLLDDVFGELDTHRRRALLRLLPVGTQKIITTTHLDWADAEITGTAKAYLIDAATAQEQ